MTESDVVCFVRRQEFSKQHRGGAAWGGGGIQVNETAAKIGALHRDSLREPGESPGKRIDRRPFWIADRFGAARNEPDFAGRAVIDRPHSLDAAHAGTRRTSCRF